VKARVERGVRQKQALSFIRAREARSQPWNSADLGRHLGISTEQAWALVNALAANGKLERGTRLVKVEGFITTEAA
jgi:anti-sigma-K factor RskA